MKYSTNNLMNEARLKTIIKEITDNIVYVVAIKRAVGLIEGVNKLESYTKDQFVYECRKVQHNLLTIEALAEDFTEIFYVHSVRQIKDSSGKDFTSKGKELVEEDLDHLMDYLLKLSNLFLTKYVLTYGLDNFSKPLKVFMRNSEDKAAYSNSRFKRRDNCRK